MYGRWLLELSSTFLIFCVVSLSGQDLKETQRTLTKNELLGGIELPAGSTVVFNEQGLPIEATLGSPAQLHKQQLPRSSIVIFFQGEATWGIPSNEALPSGPNIGGRLISPPFDCEQVGLSKVCSLPFGNKIGGKLVKVDSNACPDYKGSWLNLYGYSEIDFSDLSFPQFFASELALNELNEIDATSVEADRYKVQFGTMIGVDGDKIRFFYSPKNPIRIGKFIFPRRTFVLLENLYLGIAVQHEAKVDELIVKPGSLLTMTAYDKMGSLQLQKPAVIQGFPLPANSLVGLSLSGSLNFFHAGEDMLFKGYPISLGSPVCFLEWGPINLRIGKDSTVGGRLFPAGTSLILNAQSRLQSAISDKEFTIDGFPVGANDVTFRNHRTEFFPSGKLGRIELRADSRIGSVMFARGPIFFHENGKVSEGRIRGDQIVSGVSLTDGSWTRFNKNGDPVRVSQRRIELKVLQKPDLLNLIGSIQKKVVDKAHGLLSERRGKDVFGSMSRIEPRNVRISNTSRDRFTMHQEFWVENFLNNSPFADCDGSASLDVTVSWKLDPIGGKVYMWVSNTVLRLEWGFCPSTTYFVMPYAQLAMALSGKRFNLAGAGPLVYTESAKKINDDVEQLIKGFSAVGEKLFSGSVEVNEIYVDENQNLMCSVSYMVTNE